MKGKNQLLQEENEILRQRLIKLREENENGWKQN